MGLSGKTSKEFIFVRKYVTGFNAVYHGENNVTISAVDRPNRNRAINEVQDEMRRKNIPLKNVKIINIE